MRMIEELLGVAQEKRPPPNACPAPRNRPGAVGGCIFAVLLMPLPARFLFARPWVLCLLLLALLPFVALMFFAQPAIDDFDNAATVARLGRWGAQWYWYTRWSGRFVAIGVSTLCNPLAWPRTAAAPAGLWALRGMLLLLTTGFVAATGQLFRALLLVVPGGPEVVPRRLAWALALAVAVLGFNALSEPFTLLYWYSGAVNYLLPLGLTVGFAAAAVRALRLPVGAPGRRGWAVGATASLAAAVGSGEIALLACFAVLAALGGWLRTRPMPGAGRLWGLWLGVGLAVGLLLLGAPGNWQRLGMANPDAAGPYHRWLWLLPRTLLTAARMAARPPVLAALVLLAGMVLGPPAASGPLPSRRERWLVLGWYAVFNCLGVAFLKAAFMRDMWVEAMPARVVNVLVLQLLVATAALALWARPWLAGRLGRWQRPVLLLAAALALGTGQARWAWPELLLTAPAYQQQMAARYQTLAAARRAGAAEAVVPPLRLPHATGLLAPIPAARQKADVHTELFQDAGQKNNLFLAQYYGLPRVRLAAPAPEYQP